MNAQQTGEPSMVYHEDVTGHTFKVVACKDALDMYENALKQAEAEEKK